MRRVLNVATTVLFTAVLFIVMALPAWALGDAMTLTFVRHGQSAANAAGIIDTSVPGPGVTALGVQQSQAVAAVLAAEGHDAIFASTMVRTQQTAAPLAALTGQPVVVLPGLQEIGAGVFEGTADRGALGLLGYGAPQLAWTLGLRSIPILGGADGNAFDARVDRAVKTIYDSGARTPVVFSHGGTIATWVMMNVDNPDPLLILTHPLGNTDAVVVIGSPDGGWTLTKWADITVDPHPSLVTALFVVARNLITLPQTIAYQIGQAFAPPPIPSTTTNQPAQSPMSGVTVASESAATDHVGPAPRAVTAEHPDIAKQDTAAKKDVAVSQNPVKTPDEPAGHSSAKTSSGATDLTDGNKVAPASTPTAADVTGTKDPVTPTVAPTTEPTSTGTASNNSAETATPAAA